MRKLLRLTSAAEFLPVLLVSLMALFTGLALLGASAWLVASAALMPPLYTLALGITTVRACGIGRAVFRYGERYLSHRMAFRILTEIRLSFYDAAARCLPLRSGPARQGEFLHDLMLMSYHYNSFIRIYYFACHISSHLIINSCKWFI